MDRNITPATSEPDVTENELSGVTRNTDKYSLLPGVTDNKDNDILTNSSVLSEQTPGASEKDTGENSTLKKLTVNVVNASETETTPTSIMDNHDIGPPPSPSSGEQEHDVNKNLEVETDTQIKPIPDTTVNSMAEPIDVDINDELTKPNDTLLGITETGNGIMASLHGITDLNVLDHSYSRQNNDCLVTNPDYYATTEDEDDTIDGLLRLSATDNSLVQFPGDNSQLLPIGAYIPDVAPTDINIETAAVTAAIENIALEETGTKTTSTVSTQTTFTRPKHRPPIEISGSDSDNNLPKKTDHMKPNQGWHEITKKS